MDMQMYIRLDGYAVCAIVLIVALMLAAYTLPTMILPRLAFNSELPPEFFEDA